MRRKKSEYGEFTPTMSKEAFIAGIQKRAAARRALVIDISDVEIPEIPPEVEAKIKANERKGFSN